MTKRNPGLPRNPRDFYPTPEKAFLPLVPWLRREPLKSSFAEPCCGKGHLVRHMIKHGYRLEYAGDISEGQDAMQWQNPQGVSFIVTNPPWDRKVLHPMIQHFVTLAPTWLLLDADWMHTRQAGKLLDDYCTRIVSIGRVRWIEGSKMDGYDNAAWYRFQLGGGREIKFVPRAWR